MKKLTISLIFSIFIVSLGASAGPGNTEKHQPPLRKNYTLIKNAVNEIIPLNQLVEKARENLKETENELRTFLVNNLWEEYEAKAMKNIPSDKSLSAFLVKKKPLKNLPYADRLKLLRKEPCYNVNLEIYFNMLIKKIFNKRPWELKVTDNDMKKYSEFLLTSIIDCDLLPTLRAMLSDNGMEIVSQHRSHVDHAVHGKGQSLLDFLSQKKVMVNEGPLTPSTECSSALFCHNLECTNVTCHNKDFLHKEVLRREWFIQTCSQVFDVKIVLPLSGYNPSHHSRNKYWMYNFSYDDENSPHSFQKILGDLLSNPENFKDKTIPHDFSQKLEAAFNKEKHYFAFLQPMLFHKRLFEGEDIIRMAKILLNEEDPYLHKKSYQERQQIMSNFLQNCINNSQRCDGDGKGKLELTGQQRLHHSYYYPCQYMVYGRSPCLESSSCLYRKADFPNLPFLLQYQFLLSLSPHHEIANDLLEFYYIVEDLESEFLIHQNPIFFRLFRENESICHTLSSVSNCYEKTGFPTLQIYCQEKILSLLKDHPELIEENGQPEEETSLATITIDKEAHSFDKKLLLLETAMSSVCSYYFRKLYSQYLEEKSELHERVNLGIYLEEDMEEFSLKKIVLSNQNQ